MNEELLKEVHRLYADGRKLPVKKCLECGYESGYFFADGEVHLDPGCYCKGLSTERSSMAELRAEVERVPDRAKGWIRSRNREICAEAEVGRQRQDWLRSQQETRKFLEEVRKYGNTRKKAQSPSGGHDRRDRIRKRQGPARRVSQGNLF